MVELEQYVILVRPAAAPLLDLLVHRARHDVARCQVLQVGRVALHEPLAVAVEQDSALAAHGLGDQDSRAVDARGMELPELHVLERHPGARRHAQPVTGIYECIGARREDPSRAARGEQRRLRLQDHRFACFHFQRGHAEDLALCITDQVECHPFNEELRARPDIALIERMEHRVPGAVGRGDGALHGLLAEVRRMAAERPLVERSVRVAVERHAEMLELVHDLRGRAAHVFDRVLIAEPVGALDRVVHVPQPVVLTHVTERCADAALCRDGVRARRKHFRQDRHRKSAFRQLKRCAHSRSAGPNDDRVELAHRQRHLGAPHRISIAHPAYPTKDNTVRTSSVSRSAVGLM